MSDLPGVKFNYKSYCGHLRTSAKVSNKQCKNKQYLFLLLWLHRGRWFVLPNYIFLRSGSRIQLFRTFSWYSFSLFSSVTASDSCSSCTKQLIINLLTVPGIVTSKERAHVNVRLHLCWINGFLGLVFLDMSLGFSYSCDSCLLWTIFVGYDMSMVRV